MDVIATTEADPRRRQTVFTAKSFHTTWWKRRYDFGPSTRLSGRGSDHGRLRWVTIRLHSSPLREAGMDVSHVGGRVTTPTARRHVVPEVNEEPHRSDPALTGHWTVEEVAWITGDFGFTWSAAIGGPHRRPARPRAREAGVPVILNPAPATELDDEPRAWSPTRSHGAGHPLGDPSALRFDKSGPWMKI